MNSVEQFSPADRRHLEAAQGWLGLGNWHEANEELEEIRANMRDHPEVLKVRYEVYAAAQRWEPAADIAEAIAQLYPDSPFGVIHCAYALHELDRTQEALNVLLPAAHRFPKEFTIAYNLACYTCVLGDRKAAWQWLEKAIELRDTAETKSMALNDPDLESIWTEIQEI